MKKIIFIIVLIVISFILYVNVNASVIIPKDAIRVRVVPNSDSVYDQNIKDKVKKYVSNYMSIKLKDVYSVKKARKIINDSIPELEEDIQNIFNNNAYDEDFKVIFGDNYFPNKIYKGVIYNDGDSSKEEKAAALDLILGEHQALMITSIGATNEAVAFGVSNYATQNEHAHITIATAPGIKPVRSNSIKKFEYI